MPKIIKEISWSGDALDQLDNIEGYLSQYSSHLALQTIRQLIAAGNTLTIFPNRYPIVHGLEEPEEVRRLIVLENYEIRYLVDGDTIHILAVYHVKQNRPPFNR